MSAEADINSRDAEGRTPLMYSLMRGDHGWMLPLLTGLGADIDARHKAGRTPLMYAVLGYMSDEVWTFMREAKPDVRARDRAGKSAMDYTGPSSRNRKRLLEMGAE